MEPDQREPGEPDAAGEPSVRNSISGKVYGNSYQAENLTVQHITQVVEERPDRIRRIPQHFGALTRHYVNHKGEGENLTRIVTRDGRERAAVVALAGPGGVGKSALAAHWAREQFERLFPDGVMRLDFKTHRGAAGDATGMNAAAGDLLAQCDWQDWELEPAFAGRCEQFQSHIAGKRVLLVLENVENTAEVDVFRPRSPRSAVIVAGHAGGRFTVDQERVAVRSLSAADSAALVKSIIGKPASDTERDAVAELARLCDGIPEVLRIAVRPVSEHADYSIVDAVDSIRTDLAQASASGDVAAMLAVVADRAYRLLSPEAARLYRSLSHLPGTDIAKPALFALAASQDGNGPALLRELLDHYLLDGYGSGRFRLSKLVRLHATRCAKDEDDDAARLATLRFLAQWYADWAHSADRVMIPNRTRVFDADAVNPPPGFAADSDDRDIRNRRKGEARDWFAAERFNLLAVQRLCFAEGWLDLVMRLGESMWVMYIGGRYLEDWQESSRLAVEAATQSDHLDARVRFLAFWARSLMENELSKSAVSTRDWRKAKEKLDLARSLPISEGLGLELHASAIEFTGRWHKYQEQYREAVGCYRQARKLFQQQAGRTDIPEANRNASARGVTLQLQFIGECLTRLGAANDLRDAVDHLRQAESRMAEIPGHDRDVATIQTRLGTALRLQGEWDSAFAVVSTAVDTLSKQEWYRIEADATEELAQIAVGMGETRMEQVCRKRLREIREATGQD